MAEEFTKNIQESEIAAKNTATHVESIIKGFNEAGMSAKDLRNSLTDSLQELTNQKQVLNDTRKGFKSIRDIASQLTLNQQGLNKLSAKELKSLKEKSNTAKGLLQSAIDIKVQTEEEKKFQG